MVKKETISLEINGRTVKAPKGVTLLRAAELNDIYIPTLCSHKDLSPYGGCRLCLVEVEGMRGFQLSCYIEAVPAMKVRTETAALLAVRREVLQLILSEHPASCLICGEAEECAEYSTTVRKSGVATGCRYCANDKQCELQAVVDYLGVKDIDYPIRYRGIEPERLDPFFDRDYNLCILCGRCVRMCQEMRGTSVLAFQWRGSEATIGPAFGRSHMEAGCEFCGACVSVCPTGTLVEKASKWEGKPTEMTVSTCPYCAIGCQLELWHKQGRFVKAIPCNNDPINDGQACLKGRFCQGEVSHHFARSRKPLAWHEDGSTREVTWDEAIAKATSALDGLKAGDFAMLVSPDLSCESLYTAQKFTRQVMGTNAIECTARDDFAGGLAMWLSLYSNPISLESIAGAKTILTIGLDTRFNFSIAGVEVRKALRDGAQLVTIDATESNLALYAHEWLQPAPGREGAVLTGLLSGEGKAVGGCKAEALQKAAAVLKGGPEIVLLGPGAFACGITPELAAALQQLNRRKKTTVVPFCHGTNARGALEMGVFPELLPGGISNRGKIAPERKQKMGGKLPTDKGFTLTELMTGKCKPKVLYLVGAVPMQERPKCDFLIVQDTFAPPFPVDLFLPAASFLEADGSLINLEGRVQQLPLLEQRPDSVIYGQVRPDWQILSRIASKLGKPGFTYRSPASLRKEIASLVPGFPAANRFQRQPRVLDCKRPGKPETVQVRLAARGLMLLQARSSYTHRSVNIIDKVEGLQILSPEAGFFLHPADAKPLKIKEGDRIKVTAGRKSGIAQAHLDPALPPGFIKLIQPGTASHPATGDEATQLYTLDRNPCPVEVSKNGL